jgi:hypothetical protein
MKSRFTPIILSAALVIPVVVNAAKLPPLATMKLGENQTTYIFDPTKVTAVALTYNLTHQGPLTPHVWGIADSPLSINESPEKFLKELQLDTKFVTLHSLSGELHVRASSVKYIIEPPLQTDRERGANALVYLGPSSGVQRPWIVTETPSQVKALVDEQRSREMADDGG